MGRVKIQLKKIEEKKDRQISYSKRKDGLIKKAYELTTLCDVDVALIIFSSAGKLIIFDGKRRVEDTFKRYIDLPHNQRERCFVKSSSDIKSMSDAEYREGVLEETLKRVSLHKQVLDDKAYSQLQPPSQPFRNELNFFAELLPSSTTFHGGYPTRNAVYGGSDQFQSSMEFHGTGYQTRNTVIDGSDQLAPLMAIPDAGYVAGNAWMNNIQQARITTTTVVPNQVVGNATESNNGSDGRITTMTARSNQVVGDAAEGSSSTLYDFSDISFPF
ncbi:hypothetical protein Dsin_011519 [Dipteronia sinensis]|uniref:MADS-box domain-containing protein n=1 Tax=Dipteronia sinensis TaxID=43782 RepID=A0AAE0AVU0_9ROSI|nr:hypothetical protein Dsin_011519 [Dipteronia sinensis]